MNEAEGVLCQLLFVDAPVPLLLVEVEGDLVRMVLSRGLSAAHLTTLARALAVTLPRECHSVLADLVAQRARL